MGEARTGYTAQDWDNAAAFLSNYPKHDRTKPSVHKELALRHPEHTYQSWMSHYRKQGHLAIEARIKTILEAKLRRRVPSGSQSQKLRQPSTDVSEEELQEQDISQATPAPTAASGSQRNSRPAVQSISVSQGRRAPEAVAQKSPQRSKRVKFDDDDWRRVVKYVEDGTRRGLTKTQIWECLELDFPAHSASSWQTYYRDNKSGLDEAIELARRRADKRLAKTAKPSEHEKARLKAQRRKEEQRPNGSAVFRSTPARAGPSKERIDDQRVTSKGKTNTEQIEGGEVDELDEDEEPIEDTEANTTAVVRRLVNAHFKNKGLGAVWASLQKRYPAYTASQWATFYYLHRSQLDSMAAERKEQFESARAQAAEPSTGPSMVSKNDKGKGKTKESVVVTAPRPRFQPEQTSDRGVQADMSSPAQKPNLPPSSLPPTGNDEPRDDAQLHPASDVNDSDNESLDSDDRKVEAMLMSERNEARASHPASVSASVPSSGSSPGVAENARIRNRSESALSMLHKVEDSAEDTPAPSTSHSQIAASGAGIHDVDARTESPAARPAKRARSETPLADASRFGASYQSSVQREWTTFCEEHKGLFDMTRSIFESDDADVAGPVLIKMENEDRHEMGLERRSPANDSSASIQRQEAVSRSQDTVPRRASASLHTADEQDETATEDEPALSALDNAVEFAPTGPPPAVLDNLPNVDESTDARSGLSQEEQSRREQDEHRVEAERLLEVAQRTSQISTNGDVEMGDANATPTAKNGDIEDVEGNLRDSEPPTEHFEWSSSPVREHKPKSTTHREISNTETTAPANSDSNKAPVASPKLALAPRSSASVVNEAQPFAIPQSPKKRRTVSPFVTATGPVVIVPVSQSRTRKERLVAVPDAERQLSAPGLVAEEEEETQARANAIKDQTEVERDAARLRNLEQQTIHELQAQRQVLASPQAIVRETRPASSSIDNRAQRPETDNGTTLHSEVVYKQALKLAERSRQRRLVRNFGRQKQVVEDPTRRLAEQMTAQLDAEVAARPVTDERTLARQAVDERTLARNQADADHVALGKRDRDQAMADLLASERLAFQRHQAQIKAATAAAAATATAAAAAAAAAAARDQSEAAQVENGETSTQLPEYESGDIDRSTDQQAEVDPGESNRHEMISDQLSPVASAGPSRQATREQSAPAEPANLLRGSSMPSQVASVINAAKRPRASTGSIPNDLPRPAKRPRASLRVAPDVSPAFRQAVATSSGETSKYPDPDAGMSHQLSRSPSVISSVINVQPKRESSVSSATHFAPKRESSGSARGVTPAAKATPAAAALSRRSRPRVSTPSRLTPEDRQHALSMRIESCKIRFKLSGRQVKNLYAACSLPFDDLGLLDLACAYYSPRAGDVVDDVAVDDDDDGLTDEQRQLVKRRVWTYDEDCIVLAGTPKAIQAVETRKGAGACATRRRCLHALKIFDVNQMKRQWPFE